MGLPGDIHSLSVYYRRGQIHHYAIIQHPETSMAARETMHVGMYALVHNGMSLVQEILSQALPPIQASPGDQQGKWRKYSPD